MFRVSGTFSDGLLRASTNLINLTHLHILEGSWALITIATLLETVIESTVPMNLQVGIKFCEGLSSRREFSEQKSCLLLRSSFSAWDLKCFPVSGTQDARVLKAGSVGLMRSLSCTPAQLGRIHNAGTI